MRKTTRKKIPPVVMAVLVIAYMVPLLVLVLWTMGELGGGERAALPALACYLIFGGAVIVGVLLALRQRLREIDGGEEEDAKRY